MKEYRPMLARPAETPFSSKDWIFEIKWDGIRAISYVGKILSIRSRNNKELSGNFPELTELRELTGNVVLDGEIIIMKDGSVDFQTLIERNQKNSIIDIEYMAKKFPATYVVFDILEKDGRSLIDIPLVERKKILHGSVREGDFVVLSLFVEETGEPYYNAAIEQGVEGIVAKKKESIYEPGKRSENWLKIKRIKTCDCVIFGYTEGEGERKKTFGSLILGLYHDDIPVYVGKAGTGFSDEHLEDLLQLMEGLRSDETTLENVDIDRKIMWLKPELVCEIAYQQVTKDGKLRMPVFKKMRWDKPSAECTMEQLRPLLEEYISKRDFGITPEPEGKKNEHTGRSFVVHEHDARRLHYDLRLERDGVLKSWAVPKGLPEKAGDKRLAVQTEDHPLEYGKFEGTIPKGQYGAGTVKIWDSGLYEPFNWDKEKIEFIIKGKRLEGSYVLVKFKKAGEKNWLIFRVEE